MTQSTPVQSPDSAPGNQAALATLESLARAARQVALYGPEHPTATAALEEARATWEQQACGGRCEIRSEQGGLLWNGQPLPRDSGPASRLHEAMRARLIACIRLDTRVQLEDLAGLLVLLSQDPQELLRSGGAMRAFGAISSIHVEDMSFTRELRESEAAWLRICEEAGDGAAESLARIFDSCLRTIRNLGDCRALDRLRLSRSPADGEMESVDANAGPVRAGEAVAAQVAHTIQCAGEVALLADEEYWDGWCENITAGFLTLAPEWRAAVFRADSSGLPGRPDVLALMARDLPPAKCVSLILDYPGAIQAEPSRGLSRALSRIMLDRERRDAIEPLLRAEAAQSGISENTYRNVVELLLSRHKEAAGSDRPQPRQWLGDEMVAMTHPNRSGERDPAFDQLLETTAPESVRRARIEMLLELLHADLEIGKYAAILELLAEEGRRGSEQGETDIALGILAGLQREGGRDVQEDAGRRAVVTSALARTGTASVVADVLSEIARAGPERKWELITLLGGLGDEGMSALVSLARQPETVDVGDVVASVVRRDGASFFWLRRLLTEATADVMPQIMRALLRLGNHRVTSQLSVLADHQSLSVKLELIEAICEAGPSAASVLERLLGDADYSVRLVAVHALGALRAVEAAPTLCKLLAEQPSFGEAARARESIVTALGEMRAESAIPALRDVLLWTGFAALLANVRPRVAAAAALGKIGGEAAREALTQGARSRLRAVREACRAALAGMGPESGERQRHDR